MWASLVPSDLIRTHTVILPLANISHKIWIRFCCDLLGFDYTDSYLWIRMICLPILSKVVRQNPVFLQQIDAVTIFLPMAAELSMKAALPLAKRIATASFHSSNTEPWDWNNLLRWRHNGRDSVSSHQPNDCSLNRLFRRRSTKTSKLRVTGLCAGNSPGTGEFLAQMASNAENVSIWWRHHPTMYHHVITPWPVKQSWGYS